MEKRWIVVCFFNLFRHLRSLEGLTLNGVSVSSGTCTDGGWTSALGVAETI